MARSRSSIQALWAFRTTARNRLPGRSSTTARSSCSVRSTTSSARSHDSRRSPRSQSARLPTDGCAPRTHEAIGHHGGHVISLPSNDSFNIGGINWLALAIVIVAAVLGAWIVPRATVALLSRRLRGRRSADEDVHLRAKRADTLVAAIRSLSRYAAITAGILGVFIFAVPSAGSTVIGISLLLAVGGFAAQSVLRDIIAGSMMLFERWFDVGDAITIEPWSMSGVVETMSLRSVKLRGLGGETIRIHNQHMYGVRVARRGIREIVLEFYVTDAATGRTLVQKLSDVLPSGPMHLLSALSIEGEEQLGSLTRFTVRGAVPPGREWLIESFAIAVLKELDEEGGRVIKHGPVAYFSDSVAESRFARSVAPQLELDD
ncbi:MAG: mechanosensitive ion channel family protein [Thermoleophilia bacterium]|nr:mechanosensitive ion channel family protein [Thermoleophilia bacterium]